MHAEVTGLCGPRPRITPAGYGDHPELPNHTHASRVHAWGRQTFPLPAAATSSRCRSTLPMHPVAMHGGFIRAGGSPYRLRRPTRGAEVNHILDPCAALGEQLEGAHGRGRRADSCRMVTREGGRYQQCVEVRPSSAGGRTPRGLMPHAHPHPFIPTLTRHGN